MFASSARPAHRGHVQEPPLGGRRRDRVRGFPVARGAVRVGPRERVPAPGRALGERQQDPRFVRAGPARACHRAPARQAQRRLHGLDRDRRVALGRDVRAAGLLQPARLLHLGHLRRRQRVGHANRKAAESHQGRRRVHVAHLLHGRRRAPRRAVLGERRRDAAAAHADLHARQPGDPREQGVQQGDRRGDHQARLDGARAVQSRVHHRARGHCRRARRGRREVRVTDGEAAPGAG